MILTNLKNSSTYLRYLLINNNYNNILKFNRNLMSNIRIELIKIRALNQLIIIIFNMLKITLRNIKCKIKFNNSISRIILKIICIREA